MSTRDNLLSEEKEKNTCERVSLEVSLKSEAKSSIDGSSRKRKRSPIGGTVTTCTETDDAMKKCSKCKNELRRECYSKRQWNGPESRQCKSCRTSTPAILEKMCRGCKKVLAKSSFSNTQWKGSVAPGSDDGLVTNMCKSCVEEQVKHTKKCHDCQQNLPKKSFIPSIWKGPTNKSRCCKSCSKKNQMNSDKTAKAITKSNEMKCHQCKETLSSNFFSLNTSKGKIRCCIVCYKDRNRLEERLCHSCGKFCSKDLFSNSQFKGKFGRTRTCKACVKKQKPVSRKRDGTTAVSDQDDMKLKGDSKGPQSVQTQKSKKSGNKETTFEKDPAIIKQMISERVNMPLPHNQDRKDLDLVLESYAISESDESDMAARVVVKGSYGPISEDEIKALAIFIDQTSSAMTVDQAVSLRSSLLRHKATSRHFHIQKNAKKLYAKYKAGSSIMDLSRSVDCPPMNVFRSILTSMAYSKGRIKKCLRDPGNELKDREQQEFKAAEEADIVSNFDQDSILKFADAFEDTISKFLKEKGIAFVRQKELANEQKKTFGAAVLTPDFLILDDVKINGNQVTWIDAKAFYGANIAFDIKKVKKQMSRYIDHWGGGAILFLHGFSELLVMDDCTMLNAQHIISPDDLTSLIEYKLHLKQLK